MEEDTAQGGHARRVMAAYESWFLNNGGRAEANVLYMMGLFDRPTGAAEIAALRTPPIKGLTDGLDHSDLHRAIARLRDSGLLGRVDRANAALDAHPLVREYFGAQLREGHPSAWQTAHGRLYEHLRDTSCAKPTTIEATVPLYSAVTHACAAGRHNEAFDLYWRRIQRENEYYSLKVLGMLATDAACLEDMFEHPWDKPVPQLSGKRRSVVLDQAGETLHALGRLSDALTAMRAYLDSAVATGNSEDAAASAITLSELSLTMGKLADAVHYGRESIKFADKRKGAFHRQVSRSTLADALHQMGKEAEAEACFRDAEAIEQARTPTRPNLRSMQGYAYCDFLLSRGATDDVERRATQMLEWAEADRPLLAIAVAHLARGRALVLRGANEGPTHFDGAANDLDEALAGFRRAGTELQLPRGLLARAELRRRAGALGPAQVDIDEALEIAVRCGMRLYEADCRLESARLSIDAGIPTAAQDAFRRARQIVQETNYCRRTRDIRELEEYLST